MESRVLMTPTGGTWWTYRKVQMCPSEQKGHADIHLDTQLSQDQAYDFPIKYSRPVTDLYIY